MEKQKITFLFYRYLNNNCTKEELQQLLTYFKIADHEGALRDLILKQLEETCEEGFEDRPAVIDAFKQTDRFLEKRLAVDKIKKWEWNRYTSVAALMAVVLVIAISYYNASKTGKKDSIKSVDIDKAPGKNRATLTLSNGHAIELNDNLTGEIAEESNIKVYKQQDGQIVYQVYENKKEETAVKQALAFNTINTPQGGQYQVVLPDGSKVWLNAASSLRFPVKFIGNERLVELSGEGYFDISQDMKKPFLVKTGDQLVQVLGTQFNINNYHDADGIRTTLVEGKVMVSVNVGKDTEAKQRVLEPGQQSLVQQTLKSIQVKEVDMESTLAWKNGWFIFNDTDLKDILKQLARWYVIEVDWQHVPSLRYNGAIPRNVNLSKALEMLERTSTVSFKLTEGKITCK